jgi:hypothetical protein
MYADRVPEKQNKLLSTTASSSSRFGIQKLLNLQHSNKQEKE